MSGAVPLLRSPVALPVLKQEDTAGAGAMGPAPLLAAAGVASSSKALPLSPADAALAQQMAQVNGAPLDAEVSAGLCLVRTVCDQAPVVQQRGHQLVCQGQTLVAMLCCLLLAEFLSLPQPGRCLQAAVH